MSFERYIHSKGNNKFVGCNTRQGLEELECDDIRKNNQIKHAYKQLKLCKGEDMSIHILQMSILSRKVIHLL